MLYFYFGVTVFCEGHQIFCFVMGVTFDQYRVCIGLFNSFRVTECSANFWAIFFYYCLKFLMFSILPFFKYFLFSSVDSVATEFQFFYMLYSHCIIMVGVDWCRSSFSVCHWNSNSICVEHLCHVIFVIGRVFIYVELSNTKLLIFLSNNWFCHLIFISICRESTVDYCGISW